jgi:hypothetical protein
VSDHDDRAILALIERAGAGAPPMHVDAAAVLDGGRRRVRRRRATVAGMTLAAAASVAAVTFGALGNGLLTTQEAPPARNGQTGPGPVDSDEWDTELVFEDGTTATLRLEGDDVVIESRTEGLHLPASRIGDRPVFSTFGEGRPVMLVPDWDPADPGAVRLRSVDVPGTEWLPPSDSASVELADGRSLVVLTMSFADHGAGSTLPGELLPDGTVELAIDGPGGTTLTVVGDDIVPTLDGRSLAGRSIAGGEAYDAGGLGVVFVLEAPAEARLAAIVLEDDGPRVREDHVVDVIPVTASTLVGLTSPDSGLLGLAVESPQAVATDAVNRWSVAGLADNGHAALDGGVVAVSADTDLWLLTPEGADLPLAGLVGEDVIAVRTSDSSVLLVSVIGQNLSGTVVLRDGATAPEGGNVLGEQLAGRQIAFETVSLPDGAPVRDYVDGIDVNGDGVADLVVTQVVGLGGAPTD